VLNLDPAKLLVIGLIALIVLGPERLPRLARQLGSAWHELTRLREQVTDEVKSAFPIEDLPKIPRVPDVSSAISSAVTSFTRPISTAVAASVAGTPNRDRPVTEGTGVADAAQSPDVVTDGAEEQPEVVADGTARRNNAGVRRAPDVVIHGTLGEFAFVPDDPNMN
jgi:sec-independent protein translocase protein TatB